MRHHQYTVLHNFGRPLGEDPHVEVVNLGQEQLRGLSATFDNFGLDDSPVGLVCGAPDDRLELDNPPSTSSHITFTEGRQLSFEMLDPRFLEGVHLAAQLLNWTHTPTLRHHTPQVDSSVAFNPSFHVEPNQPPVE